MSQQNSIIMNNYISFYKTSHLIQHYYPKYASYIEKKYKNIMLYEPVTSEFIVKYITLYPTNCSKIQLYTSTPYWLEAVLYSTVNNDNLDISQHIIDDGNPNTYKLYFNSVIDKLKERYDSFNYNQHPLTTYTSNIIKELKSNKTELFIYSNEDMTFKNNNKLGEDALYFYSVLALNCLLIGGSYYFSLGHYTDKYITNLLSVLANYFKKIKIDENVIDYSCVIKCIDFTGISDKENSDLLSQLNKPLTSVKLNNKIVKKVNKYYNKIIRETQILLDGVIPKYGKTLSGISDDDLISFYNKNIEFYQNNCIALCVKYQILLKPEYISSIISFNDKVINTTITMQRPLIIELVDYSKYCDIPLSMVKNVYLSTNKTMEQKIPYKTPVRPVQRNATIIVNNRDCSPIVLKPSSYLYKDYTYLASENTNKLKKQLNLYKFNIDVIGEKEWSSINYAINIQSYLVYYIKNKFKLNVTKAFIKMYELCNEFKLVDFSQDSIKTLSTCEAPGHFINAMNYYIKSNKPSMNFDWNANSLNPYNREMQEKLGSNLIRDVYGYIKNYRDNWIFGSDDTGDITRKHNIMYFKDKYNYSIDLFTSDCGLGSYSKSDYFNQELKLAILNFCQCLIALLTLKIGGHAVFKLFIPLNESITVSLIFLIMYHFDHIYFVKQLAGAPSNNEIYIVAKGKNKHLTQDLENYLFSCLENFDSKLGLFPKELYNKYFISQVEKISEEFVTRQINSLVDTFYYFNNPEILNDHKKIIDEAKIIYSETWLQNMNFKKLDDKFQL